MTVEITVNGMKYTLVECINGKSGTDRKKAYEDYAHE